MRHQLESSRSLVLLRTTNLSRLLHHLVSVVWPHRGRRMNVKFLPIPFLLLMTGAAWSQTACPAGVAAGSASCGPSGGGFYMPPPPRQPHWKLTWGAIAMSTHAHLGTSAGYLSERKAKREALKRCANVGGEDCTVTITFNNQCAVVAWPSVPGGHAVAQGALSIEVAADLALTQCSHLQGGGVCKIVYFECADPVLVQ